MIKTLTKHGNSLAMIIEKPVLELLGVDPETPFTLRRMPGFILTPVKDAGRVEAFQSALAKVNNRYPKALKTLAE
jgi:antitoxin component of MazEF toxin-antitoxin module